MTYMYLIRERWITLEKYPLSIGSESVHLNNAISVLHNNGNMEAYRAASYRP